MKLGLFTGKRSRSCRQPGQLSRMTPFSGEDLRSWVREAWRQCLAKVPDEVSRVQDGPHVSIKLK